MILPELREIKKLRGACGPTKRRKESILKSAKL